MRKLIFIVAVAFLSFTLYSTAFGFDPPARCPSLVGSWYVTEQVVSSGEGYHQESFPLYITDQNGCLFQGYLEEDGGIEEFNGAIVGRKVFITSDEVWEGTLIEGKKLYYVRQDTGEVGGYETEKGVAVKVGPLP